MNKTTTRRRRWPYGLAAAAVVALGLPLLLVFGVRGHVVKAGYAANHAAEFDFSDPPCRPADRTEGNEGDLFVRYLGVGGLLIEWKGTSVLTAPFFSNYGILTTILGETAPDLAGIDRGIALIEGTSIGAVVVAHSHYDHLVDLPQILPRVAPDAPVLLNRSGRNMLERCPDLGNPWVLLGDHVEDWFRPTDREGLSLPLRILAVPSVHAPHFTGYHYAAGTVDRPWDCVDGRKLREMREGQPYAVLIDLLGDDGETRFRIHFQDVASPSPAGFPPLSLLDERSADLVVLSLPLAHLADGYPGGILERTGGRHALVIHYEDFFRSAELPLQFVPGLSNRRTNRFLEDLAATMAGSGIEPTGPDNDVCGPSGAAWTMPLPGEWLRFSGDPG